MNNTEQQTLAWHFVNSDKKMRYDRSEVIIKAGKTYSISDDHAPKLCKYGMHGSVRAIDALQYSPGPMVCRVEISGDVIFGDDKLVGRNRKVLWIADASKALSDFARWCALQVIDLWEAPTVTRQFLETGDESLRQAAYEAALATLSTSRCPRSAAACAAWKAAMGHVGEAYTTAARAVVFNNYNSDISVNDKQNIITETLNKVYSTQNTKLEELLMTLAPEKRK